jgi:hypothetical protein
MGNKFAPTHVYNGDFLPIGNQYGYPQGNQLLGSFYKFSQYYFTVTLDIHLMIPVLCFERADIYVIRIGGGGFLFHFGFDFDFGHNYLL